MSQLLSKERFIRTLVNTSSECPICLELYDTKNHSGVRITCGHWVGTSCLLEAINLSPSPSTCPECRAPMYEEYDHQDEYDLDDPSILGRMHLIIELDECSKRFCELADADGATFVQFIWRIMQPYSAQYILPAQSYDEGMQALKNQRRAIVNDLYEHLYQLPDNLFEFRLFITLLHQSREMDSWTEGELFEPLCSSIAMCYMQELPTPSATVLWKMIQYRLLYTEYSTHDAIHYVAMIESLLITSQPSITIHPWIFAAYRYETGLDRQRIDAIRKEIVHLHQRFPSPERPIFIGAANEYSEIERLVDIPYFY